MKKHKQFDGQIFILYISLYALSRAILELFRGDKRGYVIDGILSHSQFVALLLLITSLFIYEKLKHKNLILK